MGRTKESGSERFRAVLFDMDDTIFDHSMTCRAAIAAVRTTTPYLRRRPLVELWRDYLQLLDSAAPQVGPSAMTLDQARTARWRRLALTCGTRLSSLDAAELSQAYRGHYQRLRRAVPGAVELLRHLHGRAKVVIVTNNEVAEQEEKVRFLGIGPLLDGLVVSEAVGAAKPDPRIFEVALATAAVPPEQATMLGDSWTSDVLGAESAGVRAVWFNRFRLPRPQGRPVEELRSLRPVVPAQSLLLGESSGRGAARPRSRAREL